MREAEGEIEEKRKSNTHTDTCTRMGRKTRKREGERERKREGEEERETDRQRGKNLVRND